MEVLEIDKYIGETIGIYNIIDCNGERDSSGHLLYTGRCIICKKEVTERIFEFKIRSNICSHNKDIVKVDDFDSVRLKNIYCDMINRCNNKFNNNYKFYGEKGVSVCEEWIKNPKNFADWSYKNGYKEDLTIDRINSNEDYCPSNCRWVTKGENSKWKSTTNNITVNGITDSGRGWAKELGLGVNFINKYVRENGMGNTIKYIENFLK